MRILMATANGHSQFDLARLLGIRGHEVIKATSTGSEFLAALGRIGHTDVAVLEQAALGKGWSRLLRQLRRQAPHLPVILLLAPGRAQTWRMAILAGAFEALPSAAPEEALLQAVSRAVAYAVGRGVPETHAEHPTLRVIGKSTPMLLPAGMAAGPTRS